MLAKKLSFATRTQTGVYDPNGWNAKDVNDMSTAIDAHTQNIAELAEQVAELAQNPVTSVEAAVVTQDAAHRFVTDAEKTAFVQRDAATNTIASKDLPPLDISEVSFLQLSPDGGQLQVNEAEFSARIANWVAANPDTFFQLIQDFFASRPGYANNASLAYRATGAFVAVGTTSTSAPATPAASATPLVLTLSSGAVSGQTGDFTMPGNNDSVAIEVEMTPADGTLTAYQVVCTPPAGKDGFFQQVGGNSYSQGLTCSYAGMSAGRYGFHVEGTVNGGTPYVGPISYVTCNHA